MITDTNGDELTYWPVAIIEGDASDPMVAIIPIPSYEAYLTGSDDPTVTVFARKVGAPVWINIQDTPIPLLQYYIAGLDSVHFQVYVVGTGAVEGLERIPISITAGNGGPAGWVS